MKDDILIGDTPKAKRRRARVKQLQGTGRLWKHSTLSDIHGVVTDDEMSDFFVVTLVRNPWDRMVSYYHWLQQQAWDHPAVTLAKSSNFANFLEAELTQLSISSTPYGSYVTDRNGIEKCDLFVPIEELADKLTSFETHLGFELNNIGRVNESPRERDYRGYYTDENAAVIGQLCAVDIERFGYKF